MYAHKFRFSEDWAINQQDLDTAPGAVFDTLKMEESEYVRSTEERARRC
jgi:hypothetical protein